MKRTIGIAAVLAALAAAAPAGAQTQEQLIAGMKYLENQIQAREVARRDLYLIHQRLSNTHYALNRNCHHALRQQIVDSLNQRIMSGQLTAQQGAYQARAYGELTRYCQAQAAEAIRKIDNELWSLRGRHARLRRMLQERAVRPESVYVPALGRQVPTGPKIVYTVHCSMGSYRHTRTTPDAGQIGALIAGVPKECRRPIRVEVADTRTFHTLAKYEVR